MNMETAFTHNVKAGYTPPGVAVTMNQPPGRIEAKSPTVSMKSFAELRDERDRLVGSVIACVDALEFAGRVLKQEGYDHGTPVMKAVSVAIAVAKGTAKPANKLRDILNAEAESYPNQTLAQFIESHPELMKG